MQQAVNPVVFYAANCRRKIITVIILLQIAGRNFCLFIFSCNLQEIIYSYFWAAAFCFTFVTTGRIELPLPNHHSGIAFGGFPTGLDTGSRPVCYPTRVATHGDATGRLFYVQEWKGARSARRRNKLKRKLSSGITDKIIKHRTYWKFELIVQICRQYVYPPKKRTIKFVMENSWGKLMNKFWKDWLGEDYKITKKENRFKTPTVLIVRFLTFKLLDYLFIEIITKIHFISIVQTIIEFHLQKK